MLRDDRLSELRQYSKAIGQDVLLVQGAGGNVSLKRGRSIWIKASGTWLAQAEEKDIFIELDLDIAERLTEYGNEDYSSAVRSASGLRPSIETSLHVLLPHRVVSHFHAVDVLAWAVRRDGKSILASLLEGIDWRWVNYAKPGRDLADNVRALSREGTIPPVIILGNHGIVLGADSFEEMRELWSSLWKRLAIVPRTVGIEEKGLGECLRPWLDAGYVLPRDIKIHALGLDPVLIELCRSSWVLYPDHAVFLGSECKVYANDENPGDSISMDSHHYPVVVVPHVGAVVSKALTGAQSAMLSCFAEVALRLNDARSVRSLNSFEITSLLNWDAEKYRQTL